MRFFYTAKKYGLACFSLAIFQLFALSTFAQNTANIKGLVQDEKGQSIPSATVVAKSMQTTYKAVAQANNEGIFQFNLPVGTYSFSISTVGYLTQTLSGYAVKAGETITLTVKLKEENASLNDVVVVGYGSQQKKNITGSVSSIKAGDIKDQVTSSFDQALAGKMAGVKVSSATGQPGKNAEINIRGIGTLTAGSAPLVVVDGFPLPEGSGLSSISSADIESVEVLKDAASAAIYGSRGANGILLVTTKKGKQGALQVNANAYTGIQSVAKKIEFMDAYELATYTAVGRNNAWIDLNPAVNKASDPNNVRPNKYKIPEYMIPYLNGQQGLTNTNWQDALFRKASIQNYDVSFSGANEKIKYFVSGNYFDQQGIIVGTDFKRYSMRLNLEAALTEKLKFGMNLNPSYSTSSVIIEGGHNEDGVLLATYMSQPMFPVYNADGSLAISNQIREGGKYSIRRVENPVALATLTDHTLNQTSLLGGTYLEYEILKNFYAKTYLGGNFTTETENYYRPSYLGTYNAAAPSVSIGKKNTNKINSVLMENTLRYSNTFNNVHHLSLLGGYSYQYENIFDDYITANNFPNDNVRTLNAGTIVPAETGTLEEKWSIISYLARVQYDYKNKYLLSTSIRRDGTSRFGENTQWGWFPSASIGWRVDQEPFMKSLNFFSELKLRGSWGNTGNNLIPNYGSKALLARGNYVLGNSLVNGFKQETAPNPELSWETNTMFNVGLDIGLWNNKLNIITEYYNSVTNNLLLNVPVPASSGYSSSLRNFGKVENKGFEFSVNMNNTWGKFTWKPGVNITFNRNKVLQLGPGQDQITSVYMHITKVGLPIGSFYGYKVIGLFESAEDLANSPHPAGSAVGSYKYEDVNGDGKITQDDRAVLGSFFPKYNFGFTNAFKYRNFDLNILIQGAAGAKMFQNGAFANLTPSVDANIFKNYVNNYFISEGNPANGEFARPTIPGELLFQDSDFKLKDASFVRVRNITLGYTVPEKTIKFIKNLRVYFSTQNPFTFTSYPGYNPEANPKPNGLGVLNPGMDWSAYPVEKSFVLGLNLTF